MVIEEDENTEATLEPNLEGKVVSSRPKGKYLDQFIRNYKKKESIF